MCSSDWNARCASWKAKWPVEREQSNLDAMDGGVNLYKFAQILNARLKSDSVVVCDAGSAFYVMNQALRLVGDQRLLCSLAQAEMGAAVAMAAGVSFARGRGEVICVVGDGSFNTNPQALAIIRRHDLPVKIFVLDNGGYLSIKNSQDRMFNGRRLGTSQKDGIFFPWLNPLVGAHGIRFTDGIHSMLGVEKAVDLAMRSRDAEVVVVPCMEHQEILPSMVQREKDGKKWQPDYSDMYPFLPDEEREKEMR